jgi:hypothetical protein
MNVFPIGHYVGEQHPDGVHLVRVGLEHQTLTADEFGVWVLAHGAADATRWTEANLTALAEDAGLPSVSSVVDRLAAAGLLARVSPADQVAFAERYRLEPLLVGLGNSPELPETYAVGFPGREPVARLDGGSYELWQWAALAPSLWHTCEVRAKVGAGLGDPTAAADLVGDVLDDLRPLLANSCAYLDKARQG